MLKGESYPEDITAFYGPVIGQLSEHLDSVDGVEIQFNFELIYFNSSSAKIFLGLFETLDEAAGAGNTPAVPARAAIREHRYDRKWR